MPLSKPLYSSILDIADAYEGILLDAYGVFWGGNSIGVLPGAKEAMKELVRSGKKVGVISNATHLSKHEMNKIKDWGLYQNEHFHFYITSAEVSKQIFEDGHLPFLTPNRSFYVLGELHPNFSSHEAVFDRTGYKQTMNLDSADFIYIAVPHVGGVNQTDPDVFRAEVKKLKASGLPMICANPDCFAIEGNPPVPVVRQGSIAAIYEQLGGEVYYFGKPSSMLYHAGFKQFASYGLTDHSSFLMVGDTPETDIRGASNVSIDSALVVNTGIMAGRLYRTTITDVLEQMPKTDIPTYLIASLGVS